MHEYVCACKICHVYEIESKLGDIRYPLHLQKKCTGGWLVILRRKFTVSSLFLAWFWSSSMVGW